MKRKPDHNNPSSTFFWKDYENDEGLRVSSLAAQGLWMRLLCVAAKADPYGYVVINGCEIGVTGAARLGSVSEAEAATLLDELDRNGVFSRDRKGRIFSRRLLKESAARKKASENGKKGGNPALRATRGKQKEKGDPVNRQDKAPDKPPYPYPYPSSLRSEEEGGGDSAGASASPRPSPDFRTRILGAMGIGPDGVVGSSRFIGGQADMAEAARWLSLPGMTEDIVVREISQVCAAKRDGPPTRFRYFTGSMERLSAELTAPPLQPADISQNRRPHHGKPSAARAFDTAINRLADGIAAGTVNIDTRGSDPWEYARRQGGG